MKVQFRIIIEVFSVEEQISTARPWCLERVAKLNDWRITITQGHVIIEKRLGLRKGPSDFGIEKPTKLQRSATEEMQKTSQQAQ